MKPIPNKMFSGDWREGHVQGIAIDPEGGHIYYSFTTILLKTDFDGNPVGSVRNLAGHLGCITFDPDRRRVCGSLELKHDSIGRSIINRTGWDPSSEDNFYLVSFDVDKIDRMEMDAETDGVMRAVWLGEVVDDYLAQDEASGQPHRYGCSGIDGTAYGPVFGEPADSPKKLMVAYGIYSNLERTDNDHQVILQYDPSVIDTYGLPLTQAAPHHSGPAAEARYFLYTGNTNYGVQNLEYDPASHLWLVAVYRGKKDCFPNYPLYFIDGSKAPKEGELTGRGGERGLLLTLGDPAGMGAEIPGSEFPLGSTGVWSAGNGDVYFSAAGRNQEEKTYNSTVCRYRLDTGCAECFVLCAE
ncbi:MAG: hypothetical protein IKL84_08275 [Clostridia bacterium]|nr:hypothetical protein [Clostridia bacterium]